MAPRPMTPRLLPAELGAEKALLPFSTRAGTSSPLSAIVLDPVDCAEHVPGSEQHVEDYHLFCRVGVRAGGVEHDYAALRAVLNGDVVHARAPRGLCRAARARTRCGAGLRCDEQGLRVLNLGADLAAVVLKNLSAERRDCVHRLYLKHGVPPQNPHIFGYGLRAVQRHRVCRGRRACRR